MTAIAPVSSFDAPIGATGQPIEIKPPVPDAENFPLSALPPRLAEAISAIVDITQVPVALAAQSVLGACSLLAQARIVIEMPTRETVPPSLFLFTVASSGERKSTSDKRALLPFYERERELRNAYMTSAHQFTIDKAAYDASIAKAKRDGGKDRDKIRDNMQACGSPPNPPAIPMLLVEDPTIEGVVKLLDEAYPAIGLFSDEGAKMLGGYSMQDERQASTGAQLSQLWDGKPIKRVRGTDVTKILDGRRMSLHLMVQPGVASKLFNNRALRDQGMMSRLLVAYPKSLKGERVWHEPSDASLAALEDYHERVRKLLWHSFSYMDPETRDLTFATVALQPEARAIWIEFSDHIERQQGVGGPLEEISDLASKLGQHAIRLAAVVSYFSGGETLIREGISVPAMTAGIKLSQFYLAEALRLFNIGSVDEDSDNAAVVIDFIRKAKLERAGHRWLSRHGPKQSRPALILQRAIEVLIAQGHLVKLEGGGECVARGVSFIERKAYTVIYPDSDA